MQCALNLEKNQLDERENLQHFLEKLGARSQTEKSLHENEKVAARTFKDFFRIFFSFVCACVCSGEILFP